MGVDREKQRARWRLNKQAQREREKDTPSAPTQVAPEFVESVFRERDRRARLAQVGYLFRYSFFFEPGSWEKAICFAADVWAASVVVKARLNCDEVSVRQIREQLEDWGRTHGYQRDSLRAIIRKAQKRVKVLEETIDIETGQPYWPAFKITNID